MAPLTLFMTLACGGASPAPSDQAANTGVTVQSERCVSDAPPDASFPWVRDHLVGPGCAAQAGCHDGSSTVEMFDLRADHLYENLVGVASHQSPALPYVKPGDPDHSYLLIKLGGGDQSQRSGRTMPYGEPLLCGSERTALTAWIQAGAPH